MVGESNFKYLLKTQIEYIPNITEADQRRRSFNRRPFVRFSLNTERERTAPIFKLTDVAYTKHNGLLYPRWIFSLPCRRMSRFVRDSSSHS